MAIYLLTLLLSLYGIITDVEINAPGPGNNFVDGLDATYKHYLKEKMKLLGKLSSNGTSRIKIITSASKYVSKTFQNNLYT